MRRPKSFGVLVIILFVFSFMLAKANPKVFYSNINDESAVSGEKIELRIAFCVYFSVAVFAGNRILNIPVIVFFYHFSYILLHLFDL